MFSSPLTVHFEVTNRCNNHCPHCYASSWIDHGDQNKINIMEVAEQITKNNIFDLVITGGEPLLLKRKTLIEIFRLFKNNNIQFSLNTNGRLLNKKTAKQLKSNGLHGVLVSLHSWNNDLHDFMVKAPNAAIETKCGITNALDSGLRVTVNQVINKQNIDTMLKTAVELERIGVTGISFSRQLSPLGVGYNMEMIDAKEFIDEYIKCKEKIRIPIKNLIPTPFCADTRVKDLNERLNCTGGLTSAAISCLGEVRFCPQDPIVWGNVFEENLDVIWERILTWRNNSAEPTECNDCSFLVDCRSGCRVSSKIFTNSYDSLDPWAHGPIKNYIRKVIYNNFEPNCTHFLMPDIRFRQEKDNILLYCRNEFINVNSDALKLVSALPNKFIPDEILKNVSENRQMTMDFLELLYQKGFIISHKASMQ